MIISDLNHLEIVEGTDVVGGDYRANKFNVAIDIYKDIFIYEDVDIKKKFDINAKAKGNSALAESKADAFGKYGTNAQIFTFTETDENYSKADGTSVSVSGSAY